MSRPSQRDPYSLRVTVPDPVFREVNDPPSENQQRVLIFPDPVDNTVTIKMPNSLNGGHLVRIYGIAGNLVGQIHTAMLTNLSAQGLLAGIYQVEIVSGDHIAARGQFIKGNWYGNE